MTTRSPTVLVALSLLWGAAPCPPASAEELREFFPYFVYDTSADARGIEVAAKARGIPVEQYMDAVSEDLAAHEFNTIWLNNLDYALLPQWLDAAKRHGLRVIAQGAGPASVAPYWDNSTWPYPDGWERIVHDEVKPFWRQTAPRYRHDATLLAHVLVEEIPPEPAILDQMREIIAIVSTADPTHPMIAEYNNVDTVRLAAQALQPPVIVFGVGPFPDDQSAEDDTRYFFPLFIEQSYQAARAIGSPLWVLTQGNDFQVYQDGTQQPGGARRPTPAQLRWEVWSALLHGAKGIGFFLYHWQWPLEGVGAEDDLHGLLTREGQSTEIYEEAAAIGRILNPLASLLLEVEAEDPLEDPNHFYWGDPGLVRARMFVHRGTGQRYALLVNGDFEQPQSVSLPASVEVQRLTDLRTDTTWTPDSLHKLILEPGDGTILSLD